MRTLEGFVLPAVVTVLLHGALLFVMTANWQPERDPLVKSVPRHVKAKIVTMDQVSAKPTQKVVAPAPRPAPPKPEPPKPEPPKPKPEPPKPKPEPPKPVPPKPTPAPAPKPAPKPAPQPAPKPDPKIQEEARKREEARKAVERQKQQLERELSMALADEDEAMQSQAGSDEAMAYTDAIQATIEDNWSRPPSARRDMQVVLRIQLIPTGDVVSVSVIKSSGNEAFDRSAINAVNKAARFPEVASAPPQVFERNLRTFQLVFRPEDLRL